MNQTITLQLNNQIAQALQHLAQEKNLSLSEAALYSLHQSFNLPIPNETALSVLRQAANLPEKPKAQENTPIGDSLNHFFGSWTDEEYQAFQKTQEVFAEIDEELWV